MMKQFARIIETDETQVVLYMEYDDVFGKSYLHLIMELEFHRAHLRIEFLDEDSARKALEGYTQDEAVNMIRAHAKGNVWGLIELQAIAGRALSGKR